jgi:hypothetical protein
MEPSGLPGQRRKCRRWPWIVAGASSLLVMLSIPWALSLGKVVTAEEIGVIDAVVACTVPWVGALIVWRLPHQRVGWVLLAQSLLAIGFAADIWAMHSARLEALPLTTWAAWLSEWAWLPFIALPTLLVLWFPTGEPPSRRWLPVQRLVLALILADLVLSMGGPQLGHHNLPNPLMTSAPTWTTHSARSWRSPAVVATAACASWCTAKSREAASHSSGIRSRLVISPRCSPTSAIRRVQRRDRGTPRCLAQGRRGGTPTSHAGLQTPLSVAHLLERRRRTVPDPGHHSPVAFEHYFEDLTGKDADRARLQESQRRERLDRTAGRVSVSNVLGERSLQGQGADLGVDRRWRLPQPLGAAVRPRGDGSGRGPYNPAVFGPALETPGHSVGAAP